MSVRQRPKRPLGATKTGPPERFADESLGSFYCQVFLPLVRRATWKHRLSREDARDIVQDAFVLALTRIDARGNPKAWLVQVVDHLCINHRRKAIRRAGLRRRWGSEERCEAGEGLDGNDY